MDIVDPATPPAEARATLWRDEVRRFRAAQPHRNFPVVVHAGHPAGRRFSFTDVPGLDAGLRTEVVDRLLAACDTTSQPLVWLSRPGVPVLHDLDACWLAATRQAFAQLGWELAGFHVVTRTGWLEVLTGRSQVWKRPRTRGSAA